MSWIEVFIFITGVVAVYLTARNSIWNWWWGVVNVTVSGWLFFDGHLYSDALLQIAYFLPMQFYGWWIWKNAGPHHADDLPVSRLPRTHYAIYLVAIAAASLGWGELMKTHTDASQPFLDATLAMASVAAQYLDVRKKLESWWLWIAVDILSAFYLYPKQHYYGVAAEYAVFLGIAVWGLWQWAKLARTKEAAIV